LGEEGAHGGEAGGVRGGSEEAYEAYRAVRSGGTHLQPGAGERLPLKDVEATIVSSGGSTLKAPLGNGGATNGACPEHATPSRDLYENPRSTGVVVRYGEFRFLDVGDL